MLFPNLISNLLFSVSNPIFCIDHNLIQIPYAAKKGDHDERDYTGSGYVSGEDEEEGLPPPPRNGHRGGGHHGKCLM